MVRVPRNLDSTLLPWRSILPWPKNVSIQPKFSIWRLRETLRDDSETRIGDTKKYQILKKEYDATKCSSLVVQLPCSRRISLICRRQPLKSVYFSVSLCESWLYLFSVHRLKLKNSPTKWQSPWGIVEWNRRIILPLQDDMICPSVVIMGSDSWIFCLLICTPLSLFHSPRHDSRRRSLLMLVLSHSDTHHLSGVYGRVRVPRNLDRALYNCPVLHHFPSDFYFSRWGWGWVRIGSLESMLRTTIVSGGI